MLLPSSLELGLKREDFEIAIDLENEFERLWST